MRLSFLALLLSLFAASAHSSNAQGLAISGRAGTLGPGVELVTSLDPHFNVRLGANHFNYSRHDYVTSLEVPVHVDSDLRLTSFALIADVLPFEKIFRMSLGLVYNLSEATSLMSPAEGYTLEGKTFSPDRIGSMEATLGHRRPIQPYMGLGLGNPLRGRVTMLLDLGLLYTDAPRLGMQGDGMIAPTAQQAPDLEASLHSFKWYPVVSAGLSLNL